jgi:hypothetical protein
MERETRTKDTVEAKQRRNIRRRENNKERKICKKEDRRERKGRNNGMKEEVKQK